MGLNDVVDGRTLRTRLTAPVEAKGPPDLKRALDASFDYVASLTGLDLGDENRLVFTLPLSPHGLNSRGHWSKAAEIVKRYHAYFEALGFKKSLPLLPDVPWQKATVTATCYTRGKNDGDNLQGRLKVSLDCIVRAGYLVDDGPDHLTWGASPCQVVERAKPAYIVLTLERQEELSCLN